MPTCKECDGFHFIRTDKGWGRVEPCPFCSCGECQRLRWTNPDSGGCICQPTKKKAGIAGNNHRPKVKPVALSVPPIPVEAKDFTYSSQLFADLAFKDRDAISLAVARAMDGITQCKHNNPAISLNEVLRSFDQAIRAIFPGQALLGIRPVPPPRPPAPFSVDKADLSKASNQTLREWNEGQQLTNRLASLGICVNKAIFGIEYEQDGLWYQLHDNGVYVKQRDPNPHKFLPDGKVVTSRGEYVALLAAFKIAYQQRVERQPEVRASIGR